MQVLPSRYKRNPSTREVELVWSDVWCQESVKLFQKLVKDAKAVYFQQSLEIQDESIQFGELLLEKENGEMTQMSEELMRKKLAVSVNIRSFRSYYNRSVTSVMDRWINNERITPTPITPDSVILPEIAAATGTRISVKRQLQEALIERQAEEEAKNIAQNSFSKVNEWREKNRGIEPDLVVDQYGNLPNESLKLLESFPLSLGSRSERKSDESAASERPKPQVQQFREIPYQVANESQISLVRNGSSFSSGKMIIVPAGGSMNTNSRAPRFVDENLEELSRSFGGSPLSSIENIAVGSAPLPDSKRSPLSLAEADEDSSFESCLEKSMSKDKPSDEADSKNDLSKAKQCIHM